MVQISRSFWGALKRGGAVSKENKKVSGALKGSEPPGRPSAESAQPTQGMAAPLDDLAREIFGHFYFHRQDGHAVGFALGIGFD